MKYLKIFEDFKSSNYTLFELIQNFNIEHDTTWYVQGGCYDFSIALGKFIEKFLHKTPIYWTYGSIEEPNIHIAVQCDRHFYDASGEWETLDSIVEHGDYYTNTICHWETIKIDNIPYNNIDMLETYESLLKIYQNI